MKFKFLIIFILFFLNSNTLLANTKIAYIDLQLIMSTSLAGKSISVELEKKHKTNLEKFKKTEEELKEKEKKIISQKNILKQDEYEKKLNDLRNQVEVYRKERSKLIGELDNDRIESRNKLINQIKPIIANYSTENNLSLVIQKRNIVIGKTELDITEEILKILNKKIKKINID